MSQSGTVTNGTSCDFPYLMVASDDYLIVLSDVKAGQTIDIAEEEAAGNVVFEYPVSYYWDDVYYNFVGYRNTGTGVDEELAAALFVGSCEARQQIETGTGKVMAVGVVRDYEKATTGECNEVSYGCFYNIAEQEVSDAAD
jgi:hypothetical protein